MQHLKKYLYLFVVTFFILSSTSFKSVLAQNPDTPDFSNTIQYLTDQQLADGGFPGLAEGSDPGTTARALIGFQAANIDPNLFVSSDGKTPIEYLLQSYESYIYDDTNIIFPGNAGLILTALSLYQMAPSELPQSILDTLGEDGSFSTEAVQGMAFGTVTDLSQALAILGLSASSTPTPDAAIEYLLGTQMEDGTWSNGFGSDPDTTALVVIALLSSGQIQNDHPAIQLALQSFRDTQLDNAGWRPIWDSSMINVDSTGWITLALITAGENLSDWEVNDLNPQLVIQSVIQTDGSIGEGYVNVYSTVEALLGFAQEALVRPLPSQDTEPLETTNHQAGLVAALPDGNTILRCVEFSGDSISGYDLLVASGLELQTSFTPGMGNAVCGIEGQGCESDNCFCGMPDYWSYWHMDNAAWSYSDSGANTFDVVPGTIDGWSWGDQPPQQVTFDQICGENATLFLPAVVAESSQPTVEVLLPLVENANEEQISTETTPAEIPTETQNISQYLIFAAVILVLIVVLVLVLREKRNI